MTQPFEAGQRSRRQVLKGLGATLTLPWLESLARGSDSQASTEPPRRWALMLFPNGVSERDWWARGEGQAMELSSTLQPLADHREDVLFINGLRLFDRTFGPHWPFFTNFLSGKELEQSTIPDVAESLDQRLARKVGRQTPLASLHLGIEPVVPGLRLGVPGVYYSTVSWSSRNTPIPPDIFPRSVFDRLFDTSRVAQDRSVLDFVNEQARDLSRGLGVEDRHKLNGFMENVREVERRIDLAGRDGRLEGWRPKLNEPSMARPVEGMPQDIPEHTRLMLDLFVLALQMDRTRIITMLFQNDGSRQTFEFLDGVSKTPMHGLSHYKNDNALAEYRRINEFHVRQLAYVLDRMKSVDEGDGRNLLDSTMLLFGSNMMDGNSHDATHLPLVLCGRGGQTLRPGRVLDFTDRSDEERRLCNLFVAMQNRMGLSEATFGNSIHALPGLD